MHGTTTQTFDVIHTDLNQHTLVEASAGTGKTYSIAILVLRLIIEENIGIDKILAVTYTKAAVAELQTRIREFIQIANKYIDQIDKLEDRTIKAILEKGITKLGGGTDALNKIKNNLKTSLYLMDEANIMTIHGFCQQMLSEFAYATDNDLSAELVADISDIIQEATHQFWRKEISTLSMETLDALDLEQLYNSLPELFSNHLKGMQYAAFHKEMEIAPINFEAVQQAVLKEIEDCKNNVINLIENQKEALEKISLENKAKQIYTKFYPLLNEPQQYLDAILTADGRLYKMFSDELRDAILLYKSIADQEKTEHKIKETFRTQTVQNLKYLALKKYIPIIEKKLKDARLLTFDNIIVNLKNAVTRNSNDALIKQIREKFDAVFIDEFQDTDNTQFAIFNTLFLQNSASKVFLIGDPKQSIYGFRGADVDSYVQATASENLVKKNMTVNYRSSVDMVNATNDFFQSVQNPFNRPDEDISYVRVSSSDEEEKEKKEFKPGNKKTLEILGYKTKDDYKNALANYISEMLGNPAYKIVKNGVERGIQPSDIGILSRSKKDGNDIKVLLEKRNIPAVQVMDQKVLQTEEAKGVVYLLEAMLQPTVKNIEKAQFLSFLNIPIERLEDNTILHQELTERFRKYQKLLEENGIYAAFTALINDYNLQEKWSSSTSGLRTLTNVLQIVQLANEAQINKGKNVQEIILWLYKNQKHAEEDGDAFTIQIESDEEAVQIATIHASKGLEYNIVFVLGLENDFKEKRFQNYSSIKIEKNGNKIFFDKGTLGDNIELYQAQENQEARRLLYVALTRAKYKCVLFYSKGQNTALDKEHYIPDNTTLTDFLAANIPNLELDAAYAQIPYSSTSSKEIKAIPFPTKAIEQSFSDWQKMSYSSLAAVAIRHEYEDIYFDENEVELYDTFIYTKLGRGAYYGDKLHKIFEQIDFTQDFTDIALCDALTKNVITTFNKQKTLQNGQTEIIEDHSESMLQLLHHTMNANINIDGKTFRLKEVPASKRLVELGFNFNVAGKKEALIDFFIENGYQQLIKPGMHINGLMNGFIDLFFEHDGKYYILDWKSNYLGNHLAAYSTEKVAEAMTASNYHLQYLIYTLAVHKFLKSRLGAAYDYEVHFGGVVYAFLRGLRAESETGLFTIKPAKAIIMKLETLLN